MISRIRPVGLRIDGVIQDYSILDCLGALPAAVDQMRADRDDRTIPARMIGHTRQAFAAMPQLNAAQALAIATTAQDQLYRHVSALSVLDHYTRRYVAGVVRHFFLELSGRGVRTFYVLDNQIREDRFQAVIELFGHAGIGVVTPRLHGGDWEGLRSRIELLLEEVGHAAYIEPDAQWNHMEDAVAFAKGLPYLATFRNAAPTEARVQLLSSGGSPLPLMTEE